MAAVERLTLRNLYFHFLSHLMGYDCGDSFTFDFWTNWISIWLKIERKLSPQSYPIQFERKCNISFLIVQVIPQITTDFRVNTALRHVVRSSFVFANSNCDWVTWITWFMLANHSCWLRIQMKIKLHVERLYNKAVTD